MDAMMENYVFNRTCIFSPKGIVPTLSRSELFSLVAESNAVATLCIFYPCLDVLAPHGFL